MDDDDDEEKRIVLSPLLQKLQQIKTLKERLANGDKLEVEQLDKIKREAELAEELENLRLWREEEDGERFLLYFSTKTTIC